MTQILLLYYSRHGSISRMAQEIAHGVEAEADCHARLRTLPPVSTECEAVSSPVPEDGPPYAGLNDLRDCDGLIMGSPSYFGNMAAELKHFIDQSSPLWLSGALIGKPAGVFTASSSLHGGQESVLLNMMLPLLHHGMVITGIPYSEPALQRTATGATPYGASHVSGPEGRPLSEDEIDACRALGQRCAQLAKRLAG